MKMNLRYLIHISLVSEFFTLFSTSADICVGEKFCRDSKYKIEPCRCSGKPGSFIIHCFDSAEKTQKAIDYLSTSRVKISSFHIRRAKLTSQFFGDAKVESVNFGMGSTLSDIKIPHDLFEGQENSLKEITVDGSLSDLNIFVRELTSLTNLKKLHVTAPFLNRLQDNQFDLLCRPEAMEDLKLGANMRFIGQGAFATLKNLKKLYLSNNVLKTMDGCCVSPMRNLVFFEALGNDFEKFPSFLRTAAEGATLHILSTAEKMYFTSKDVEAIVSKKFTAQFYGAIICDCAWYPLAKLSDDEKSKLNIIGTCAHPTSLKNEALVKLTTEHIAMC